MKVRLIKDVDTTGGPMKAGEIIEHSDAGLLILTGVAEKFCESSEPESATVENGV